MSDALTSFALGLGMLIALGGPLLLLPAAWLLQRLLFHPLLGPLTRGRLAGAPRRAAAWGLAVLTLAAALAATYFPGRATYRALCADYATPRIDARVAVDGFHAARLFPYAARAYLDAGFAWVEAPDPYRGGRQLRYSLGPDGALREAAIDSPQARHAFVQELHHEGHGIVRVEKRITVRSDGRLLARAGQVTFAGGPLAIFLGAYAVRSCPDPRDAGGDAAFATFVDLERRVLRAAAD